MSCEAEVDINNAHELVHTAIQYGELLGYGPMSWYSLARPPYALSRAPFLLVRALYALMDEGATLPCKTVLYLSPWAVPSCLGS